MTVLIGTSGDTGSAAISAVRGLEWVDVVVLLPKVCSATSLCQLKCHLEKKLFKI